MKEARDWGKFPPKRKKDAAKNDRARERGSRVRRPRNVGAAQDKPRGRTPQKRPRPHIRNAGNPRRRNGAQARNRHPARRRLFVHRGGKRHERRKHTPRSLQNRRGRHGARRGGGEVYRDSRHLKERQVFGQNPHEGRKSRENRFRLFSDNLYGAGYRDAQGPTPTWSATSCCSKPYPISSPTRSL